MSKPNVKGFKQRLADGEYVIIGEGFVYELERRGYLNLGHYIPLAVLDDPDVVRMMHKEFSHAGSDVVEACTYFGHRTQLELIDRADDFEPLNRNALKIAKSVADEFGCLMAGAVCNTMVYTPDDKAGHAKIKEMFKEQIIWSVEEGADYMIAETFFDYGEAVIAMDCIKEFGNGLPMVITLNANPTGKTFDGVPLPEACRRLEEAGADVVGVNCARGPDTMIPLVKEIRKVCKGPIACIPNPYRTSEKYPGFQQLPDERTGELACPVNIDAWLCSRDHIRDFTKELMEVGVQYMGLCCGNRPFYLRTMAETVGRTPLASNYGPRLDLHHTLAGKGKQERAWASQKYKEELQGVK